jgi:hypothetical protein
VNLLDSGLRLLPVLAEFHLSGHGPLIASKPLFVLLESGTRADRPGLAKTLEMLREGDTLVVWKFDRLGPVGQAAGRSGRRSSQAGIQYWREDRLRSLIRADGECRDGISRARRRPGIIAWTAPFKSIA